MKKNSPRFERGQDLVEYALILPAMLLILMGIFDLGRVVYYYSAIFNAAREGARYGSVHPPEDAAAQAAVATQIDLIVQTWSVAVPVDPANVNTSWPGGSSVRVSVLYTFQAITPIIGSLLGGGGTITLTTTSTMPLEYVP